MCSPRTRYPHGSSLGATIHPCPHGVAPGCAHTRARTRSSPPPPTDRHRGTPALRTQSATMPRPPRFGCFICAERARAEARAVPAPLYSARRSGRGFDAAAPPLLPAVILP